MCQPVTYEDSWSNDDDQEHNLNENINSNTGSMEINVDKGKRSQQQQVEEDGSGKKRKDRRKRITWTRDLHKTFVEAINSLGKEKAYPTTILEMMNVPGLTRSQVASHLQKYQDHLKNNNRNSTLVPPQMQDKGIINSSQVENESNHGHKTKTSDNNNASSSTTSTIQPPLKLNSSGISYMTINNIKARLQEAPPLPLPLPLPNTTIINSDSDEVAIENQASILINNTSFGSVGSSNSTTTTTIRNEVHIPNNDYSTDPWVVPCDYYGLQNHNNPLTNLAALPKFVSGNLDLLEDVGVSINPNNFSNSDSLLPFGVEAPFNSTVSVDDTFMESDLCHLEMTVNLLDELDDHLINGPW